MSNLKQMNPELIEALKAAGMEFETRVKPEELSTEQKVQRGLELKAKLDEAKANKDEKLAKKLRRQLRSLGIYLSQLKKESTI